MYGIEGERWALVFSFTGSPFYAIQQMEEKERGGRDRPVFPFCVVYIIWKKGRQATNLSMWRRQKEKKGGKKRKRKNPSGIFGGGSLATEQNRLYLPFGMVQGVGKSAELDEVFGVWCSFR